MATALNRLFLALWPDPAIRQACADAARALKVKMSPAGRWTAVEKLHVTLFFLGSQLSAEQEAAVRQVASLVRAPPFTLTLDHAGCFRKRGTLWWIGARTTPPELAALHQRLHEALLSVRVVPDRQRFTPHLTILRDADRVLPDTPIPPIAWPLRDFALVRSRLDRQPADYEVIARFPLATPAGGGGAAADQLRLWEN